MTSFCRRVIAMRMIVANKRRIASVFGNYYFDTGPVVELGKSHERRLSILLARAEIPVLKFTAQKLAKNTCQTASDEPR